MYKSPNKSLISVDRRTSLLSNLQYSVRNQSHVEINAFVHRSLKRLLQCPWMRGGAPVGSIPVIYLNGIPCIILESENSWVWISAWASNQMNFVSGYFVNVLDVKLSCSFFGGSAQKCCKSINFFFLAGQVPDHQI